MKKIIGLGNALVDMMVKLPDESLLERQKLQKGGMFLVDETSVKNILKETQSYQPKRTSGGSAANTIHALAKLGAEVGYIGKVGDDETGRFFSEDMKAVGIEPKIQLSTSPTGVAAALISPDSERTFATFLGAAVELSAEDITQDMFKGYDILHIEGYLVQNHELVERAMKLAKENGLMVSIDMASFNVVEDHLEFFKHIVKEYVDILFANEEEAKAYTNTDPKSACELIAKDVQIAVVKIGKEGAYIKEGEQEMILVPAFKADSKDTTGAGDSYAAGFLYGYINKAGHYNSSRIGALIAGKIIEHIGAKMPDSVWDNIQPEIKALLNK